MEKGQIILGSRIGSDSDSSVNSFRRVQNSNAFPESPEKKENSKMKFRCAELKKRHLQHRKYFHVNFIFSGKYDSFCYKMNGILQIYSPQLYSASP